MTSTVDARIVNPQTPQTPKNKDLIPNQKKKQQKQCCLKTGQVHGVCIYMYVYIYIHIFPTGVSGVANNILLLG